MANGQATIPGQATGLEWKTSSPPPQKNFPEPPVVTEDPYEYPPLGKTEDTQE